MRRLKLEVRDEMGHGVHPSLGFGGNDVGASQKTTAKMELVVKTSIEIVK